MGQCFDDTKIKQHYKLPTGMNKVLCYFFPQVWMDQIEFHFTVHCPIFAFFQGQIIFKMLNFILPCNHVICVQVQRCCELCLGVLVTRVGEVLVQ